ncbi:transposase [Undibacterium rugosum]|uniref:transposase n=1 Tax=Undibacterium rugosum TaxID=2762291 RepID=UPI001B82DBDD|nr:transposase [Undibacterium rugosum]MBR7777944.1 transposase [Undibacterium rugosum]
MNDELDMPCVRRRRHSAEFKNQVINACLQPGVSIAATSLRYGLNANMVCIWIRAHERIRHDSEPAPPSLVCGALIPSLLERPVKV